MVLDPAAQANLHLRLPPQSVGIIASGKLADGRDVINTVPAEFRSSPLLFLKNKLSSAKFLVDTGASVSVFPHLPCSPSAPGSGVQLRTADSSPMNTYGSRSLALQFGSKHFEWSFLLANFSMPILGSDFLRHNHLLVDVAGSRLLDSSTLESIPAVSSSSANNKSDPIQLFFLPLRSYVISCLSIQMLSPPKFFLQRILSIQSAIPSIPRLVRWFLQKPAN